MVRISDGAAGQAEHRGEPLAHGDPASRAAVRQRARLLCREKMEPAGAGRAGWARKLGGWLARWWLRAPDGRMYRRRWADVLVAAAGLGVVVVCGVLVANRLVVGTDVALFRRINHWPGGCIRRCGRSSCRE
jgi:hypothetical protein